MYKKGTTAALVLVFSVAFWRSLLPYRTIFFRSVQQYSYFSYFFSPLFVLFSLLFSPSNGWDNFDLIRLDSFLRYHENTIKEATSVFRFLTRFTTYLHYLILMSFQITYQYTIFFSLQCGTRYSHLFCNFYALHSAL